MVAWVKIAPQNTGAVIFDSGKGGINGFLFQRSNDVLYGVAKTRSRYVMINQNTGFRGLSGKWAHVAMTYKGNPLLISSTCLQLCLSHTQQAKLYLQPTKIKSQHFGVF